MKFISTFQTFVLLKIIPLIVIQVTRININNLDIFDNRNEDAFTLIDALCCTTRLMHQTNTHVVKINEHYIQESEHPKGEIRNLSFS